MLQSFTQSFHNEAVRVIHLEAVRVKHRMDTEYITPLERGINDVGATFAELRKGRLADRWLLTIRLGNAPLIDFQIGA